MNKAKNMQLNSLNDMNKLFHCILLYRHHTFHDNNNEAYKYQGKLDNIHHYHIVINISNDSHLKSVHYLQSLDKYDKQDHYHPHIH